MPHKEQGKGIEKEMGVALGRRGFDGVEPFGPRGDTGAVLYSCHKNGTRYIVKVGTDAQSAKEIGDNEYGFKMLRAEGAGSILPEAISTFTVGGHPAIIMEYLGRSFRDASKDDPTAYAILFDSVESLARNTLRTDAVAQARGFAEIASHLRKWYGLLSERGIITKEALNVLDSIREEPMNSDKCTIMLLDFTPDNIFISGDGIKYIDPWVQGTYSGSLIPSISIFMGLLETAYGTRIEVHVREKLNRLVRSLGRMLDLDERQIEGQMLLGHSLQLALSSFVRIENDPKTSKGYALLGLEKLSQIRV